MQNNRKCPECGIGYLIQLACENEDVCYCPICESVIHDIVAWKRKEEYETGIVAES